MMSPVAAASHPYRTPMTRETNDPDRGGAELVDAQGRPLVLTGASIAVVAHAGIARTVLEQRFENPYPETLRVTYKLPLPADGAVSGFEFDVGARRVVGEVDTKQSARERFERAITEGKTAALLDEERSSVFTETVGNIPPRATIVVRVTVDQRLLWLPEGAWEFRFPTVIGPRYSSRGTSPAEAARVAVPTVVGDTGHRVVLSVDVRDRLPAGRRVESPSHRLTVDAEGRHTLADGKSKLDRDVVVRWAAAEPEVGVRLATARPERTRAHAADAYGLVTLVPPAPKKGQRVVPRDLIVLLDTSGSMAGVPLAAAKSIIGLAIDSLGEHDSLELIEFADAPRRFRPGAMPATPALKREAAAWVQGLEAGGCTEMRQAVFDALRGLRHGAQRQVVLVTDGYIDGEREIVELLAERLPPGCRFHVVGVGSAANRSLSAALARAGRGAEVLASGAEDAERAAARLLLRTNAPILTDVTLSGDALIDHAPDLVPDVFAQSPLLCAVRLSPSGGTLVIKAQGPDGAWEERVAVPPLACGEGDASIVALYGREHVEDLETRWTIGRDQARIDHEIERTGIVFQISTRLTSWVAVDHVRSIDPDAGSREETLAHELPLGTLAESFGLRSGPPPVALASPVVSKLAVASYDRESEEEDVATLARHIAPPAMAPRPAAGAPLPPPPAPMGAPPPAARSIPMPKAPSPVRATPPQEKAKKAEVGSEWDEVTADLPSPPDEVEALRVARSPESAPPQAPAAKPQLDAPAPARAQAPTQAPTPTPPHTISPGMVLRSEVEPTPEPAPVAEGRAPVAEPVASPRPAWLYVLIGALAALLLALVAFLLYWFLGR